MYRECYWTLLPRSHKRSLLMVKAFLEGDIQVLRMWQRTLGKWDLQPQSPTGSREYCLSTAVEAQKVSMDVEGL